MTTQNPYLANDPSAMAEATQGGASTGTPHLSGSARTQQKVGQVVDGAQETVGTVVDGAQEKVGQVVDQAKQQTTSLLSARKDQAAETLYTVAHALRQTGQQLREQDQAPVGQFADTVATRVESVSGYLQNRDVRQLVDESESFARRNPGVFIGGAVTLGVLAARFLKSSRRGQQQNTTSRSSTALTPYPYPYPSASAAMPRASVGSDYPDYTPSTTPPSGAYNTTATTPPSGAYDTAGVSGAYDRTMSGGAAGSNSVRVSSDEPTPAVVTDAFAYGTDTSAHGVSGAGSSGYNAGGAAVEPAPRTTPGL